MVVVTYKRWSLLEIPTVSLWLGKFWCFGLVVTYRRWSLTRGGHTLRLECSLIWLQPNTEAIGQFGIIQNWTWAQAWILIIIIKSYAWVQGWEVWIIINSLVFFPSTSESSINLSNSKLAYYQYVCVLVLGCHFSKILQQTCNKFSVIMNSIIILISVL